MRLMIVFLFLSIPFFQLSAVELFVARSGDDMNPGTKEQPFQTLEKARDTVRGLIADGLREDVTVFIRGGTYELEDTITFDERDSGTAAHSVTYEGYKDERVVFSGGRQLEGTWKKHKGQIWKLHLPGVAAGTMWFRQLFADDNGGISRMTRARWPNRGQFVKTTAVDNENLIYTLSEELPMKELTPESNAELEIFVSWVSSRARIKEASGSTIKTETVPGHCHRHTMPKPDRSLFLEHAYAFIDQPGEWYLDQKSGMLYLMTEPGDEPGDKTFFTGRITTLLRIAGEASTPVINLHFRKLRFHYSFWDLPEIGFGDMWTGNYGTMEKGINWVKHVPPAIESEYVRNCSFEMCEIAHMGASGIGFGRGTVQTRVVGCHVHDIAAIGINFGWRTLASPSGDGWVHYDRVLKTDVNKAWGGERNVPSDNEITDNKVHHCGQVYSGCSGIFLAFNRNFNISYNVVYGCPYGCIIHQHYVGERENCISSYNQVFDSMLLLGDGGGIYNSVTDVGAHIHHNYVYDIVKNPGSIAWGNVGLYLDDFGNNCLAEDNAFAHIATGELHLRSKGHLIRNNRGMKRIFGTKAKDESTTIIDPEKQAVELTDAERKTLAAETGPREPYRSWLGIN